MASRASSALTRTLALLALAPAALEAQPTPAGTEFQVNTTTDFYQYDVAIAVSESGSFVVAWESDFQDGSDYSVFAQRFHADGTAAGGELQLNSFTTGDQSNPELAIDASGNFVAVWVGDDQDGDDEGVFAQRFNADGTRAGGEFQVNTYTTADQDSPAVAMNPTGDFVVVWKSDPQDGSGDSVHGQRFNADGTAAGGEFQINTFTTEDQDNPEIAIDEGGNFVVVWETFSQDGSGEGIEGRLFNSDGTPATGEFQVNTYTTGDQEEQRVAMAANGDFVAVWLSSGQDGNLDSVHGQRFNADGTRAGGEFQINTYVTGDQDSPDVVMKPNGAFVAVWESGDQDGSSDSVHGQRYGADGAPVGDEFQINSYTTADQDDPAVGVDDSGNFVVVWESEDQDGDGDGVFGQRYTGPLPVLLEFFSVE